MIRQAGKGRSLREGIILKKHLDGCIYSWKMRWILKPQLYDIGSGLLPWYLAGYYTYTHSLLSLAHLVVSVSRCLSCLLQKLVVSAASVAGGLLAGFAEFAALCP